MMSILTLLQEKTGYVDYVRQSESESMNKDIVYKKSAPIPFVRDNIIADKNMSQPLCSEREREILPASLTSFL